MTRPIGVSIRLLGQFAVETASGQPACIRSRKARALVGYLAMKPEYRASREELATLLWGDTPDALARHSLRQCLSSLRADLRLAPTLLSAERDGIELAADPLIVDARELITLSRSTRLEELSRAASLYRGDFLADLILDIDEFDAWSRQEGERLRATAAHVFGALARLSGECGDGERAIDAAERLVALEPTREDWQRTALRMWARHRGRDAALGRAKDVGELIGREFGVLPEKETRALIDAIDRGTVGPAAPDEPQAPGLDQAPIPDVASTVEVPATIPPTRPQPPRWRQRTWSITAMAAVGVAVLAWVIAEFTVGWPFGIPAATSLAESPKARLDAASVRDSVTPVVVLPFTVDTGNGPEDETFVRTLTHDLIGYLARYPQLRVVSDQTSDLYRGRAVDIAKVGAELNVPYAIVGHAQLDDGHVRVTFNLVDTASRLNVWSGQAQRDRADMALVADEIARGTARSFQIQLTSADARHRRGAFGPSSETADLLVRGRAAEQLGPWSANMSEAMRLFDEALQRDPQSAAAMLGIARVTVMANGNFIELDPPANLDRAERLLDDVLTRQPNSPTAHYIFAQLQRIRGRYPQSLQSFQRALELNPSFIFAHANIGNLLTRMGDPREGLKRIQEYMRMAPPNEPAMGYGHLFAAEAQLALGEKQAALESMLRANALFPGSPRMQGFLAAIYAITGDHANAAKYAAAFRRSAPRATHNILEPTPQSTSREDGLTEIFDGLRLALSEFHG